MEGRVSAMPHGLYVTGSPHLVLFAPLTRRDVISALESMHCTGGAGRVSVPLAHGQRPRTMPTGQAGLARRLKARPPLRAPAPHRLAGARHAPPRRPRLAQVQGLGVLASRHVLPRVELLSHRVCR